MSQPARRRRLIPIKAIPGAAREICRVEESSGSSEMSGGNLIATVCIVVVFAAFMLSLAYAERTTRQK